MGFARERWMTDQEIIDSEDLVYRQFAGIYPHECYASDPERFWQFYHKIFPNVSRGEMERILEATNEQT